MRKIILGLIFLLSIPFSASAAIAYKFPNDKWFSEFKTPSGFLIWAEVIGPLVTSAHAAELSLEDQIKNYITTMAQFYETDPKFMLQLAGCESTFNPEAQNDHESRGGISLGLFQWQIGSWKHYNNIFKSDFDRKSWQDQVKLTARVLKKYGSGDWESCTKYIKIDGWDFVNK